MTSASAPDYGLGAEYEHIYSGKVRDLYRTPDDRLLFVASDRISAYDWVLPTLIPDKGRILTALSKWWFKKLEGVVPNHVASGRIPKAVAGRAMVCERLDMLPIECVVRGYLAGSGFTDYLAQGSICGNGLPPGLKDGALLPKHLFTPATKAALGDHDVNVTFDEVIVEIGQEEAQEIKRMSMAIYEVALETARERGLILADTKFEFGFARSGKNAGRIVLADEVLTPDSSRYWSEATWSPGGPQPSFDKQYVRDWLTSPESGWDKSSNTPPPPLPEHVVEQTRAKYIEVYEILTGDTFA